MLKFQNKNKYLEFFRQSTTFLDLFAQPPMFRILKKQKFTTLLGHILTIIIALSCSVFFFISLQDLLQQSSPSIVFTEEQLINSDPIYLTQNNFTIVFTLVSLNFSSLRAHNQNYQFSIQNCHRKRTLDPLTGALLNVTQNCTNYQAESCNVEKHFGTDQQKKFFKNINIKYQLCVNSEQWKARPMVLQGTVSGENYQFITVAATLCKNTTEIQTCNPVSVQQQGLASGYYSVYISDTLNKLARPGDPFEPIVQLAINSFSNTSSKDIQMDFKLTKTFSDVGLVTQQIQENVAISQSSLLQSQNFYNGQYLIYHIISLDQKAAIYDRKYTKLQQILGSLGGLWQVLYFFVQVFIGPMVYSVMNFQMANKLFSFSSTNNIINAEPSCKLDQQNSDRGFIGRSQNEKKKRSFKLFKDPRQSIRVASNIQNQNQLLQFIKERNKSLNLGFKQILQLLCGCRSKEKRLLNYATEKIQSKLDVIFILKKLVEIDKLKQLILNDQQLKLFEFLPKPIIPLDLFDKGNEDKLKDLEQENKYRYILMQEKTNLIKITEAYNSYKQIKNLKEQSRIDQLLMDQLDDEIIYMFNGVEQGSSQLSNFIPNFLDNLVEDEVKSIEQSPHQSIENYSNDYIQKPK